METLTQTQNALKSAEAALSIAIDREKALRAQNYQDNYELVHDIKNPLTAMMATISLLKSEIDGPLGSPVYEKCVGTLDSSSQRLLSICNSVLEGANQVTRELPDDVPIVLHIEETDVGAIISEIADLFSDVAKSRGIKLANKICDDFPLLMTDPSHLYRALMNVVSNAVKFTPTGGKVTINAEVDETDGAVVMVVRDSGIGISYDRIQGILRQGDSTVSPHDDEGSGLGLGIVSRLVKELGGCFDIVSSENRGTKIKLMLPLRTEVKDLCQRAS